MGVDRWSSLLFGLLIAFLQYWGSLALLSRGADQEGAIPHPPLIERVVIRPPPIDRTKSIDRLGEEITYSPWSGLVSEEEEITPGEIMECIVAMQELLALPEPGEVTCVLTINDQGVIEKVKVLASESRINQNYLERELVGWKFDGKRERKEELILTFCHEV
ncbi:MAG: hypothetical protein VXZ72_01265 [Chlamydiota bacterium]|nr:hypothetical protein [Chlamydiota bacterium]